MATRPVAFLQSCRRRYGDCFTLTAAPWGRAAYFADPSDVHAVFQGDPGLFGVARARDPQALVMGSNTLFVLEGDDHVRERRLLSPPFHGSNLRRQEAVIREEAEAAVGRWPIETPFALRPRLHDITLNVIVRIVFGGGERVPVRRLRDIFGRLIEHNPTLVVAFPAIRRDFGRWSPWGRYLRLRREADALLYEEVDRARAGGDEDSVLGMLATMLDESGRPLTHARLRDELTTLLIAGEETTASALAWTFERLTRNPPTMRRLVEEVDAGEGEAYLDAVISESLRTRPILTGTTRYLKADADVAGYRLPAGTILVASQVLVHSSEGYYRDPARFAPERFLQEKPDPPAWIAFGGGPRRCLGASLAQLEMKTVLRTVLQRLELRPARRRAERIRAHHVTLAPSRGAEVVAAPRRSAAA